MRDAGGELRRGLLRNVNDGPVWTFKSPGSSMSTSSPECATCFLVHYKVCGAMLSRKPLFCIMLDSSHKLRERLGILQCFPLRVGGESGPNSYSMRQRNERQSYSRQKNYFLEMPFVDAALWGVATSTLGLSESW